MIHDNLSASMQRRGKDRMRGLSITPSKEELSRDPLPNFSAQFSHNAPLQPTTWKQIRMTHLFEGRTLEGQGGVAPMQRCSC